MKSATFFEALASAAENPGEEWRREDIPNRIMSFLRKSDVDDADDSDLVRIDNHEIVHYFVVWSSDLTATWVCETSGLTSTLSM